MEAVIVVASCVSVVVAAVGLTLDAIRRLRQRARAERAAREQLRRRYGL